MIRAVRTGKQGGRSFAGCLRRGRQVAGGFCAPQGPFLIRTSRPQGGFTLLEVLLVLGLLVVFGSLAWPALRLTLAGQRLRTAAEQIRVEWTRARLAAIKNQTPYLFRFVPGESVYTIEPLASGSAGNFLASGTWDRPAGDFLSGAAGSERASSAVWLGASGAERSLPEGIFFLAGQAELGQRGEAVLEEWAAETGQINIFQPETVVFFPDGTATDAEVILQNAEGRQINVWIRGITGVVQVGPIIRAEDTSGWWPAYSR